MTFLNFFAHLYKENAILVVKKIAKKSSGQFDRNPPVADFGIKLLQKDDSQPSLPPPPPRLSQLSLQGDPQGAGEVTRHLLRRGQAHLLEPGLRSEVQRGGGSRNPAFGFRRNVSWI